MSETQQILLAHLLKEPKLPAFPREHEKVARLCGAENMATCAFCCARPSWSCPPGNRNYGFRPGKIIPGSAAMAIDISKSFLLGNQVCASAINRFVVANEHGSPSRLTSDYALRSFADEHRHGIRRKTVGAGLIRGAKKGGFVFSSNAARLAETS